MYFWGQIAICNYHNSMSVIFFLIILGVVVAGGFLAGFIWAVKSGQYDDTESPAMRMLFDDAKPVKKKMKKN